jgi:hypothetical protein
MNNQLKAITVHKYVLFFGMTYKMLHAADKKTQLEFADVYLDFIREYGIPSSHPRDKAKI